MHCVHLGIGAIHLTIPGSAHNSRNKQTPNHFSNNSRECHGCVVHAFIFVCVTAPIASPNASSSKAMGRRGCGTNKSMIRRNVDANRSGYAYESRGTAHAHGISARRDKSQPVAGAQWSDVVKRNFEILGSLNFEPTHLSKEFVCTSSLLQ